jgi:GNAT superfamily N-acetyltransferase
MNETTRQRIDELWARRLGCEPSRMCTAGIHMLEGERTAAQAFVFVLSRAETLVLRGDRDATRQLRSHLGSRAGLPAVEDVRAALGERIERIVGPACIAYRETAPELPDGVGEVRPVGAADHAALSRLRDAVTDEEWQHAGIAADGDAPIFGAFQDERLLAAASFATLLGVAAHIGVVTHPSERGRGAGRRVVAAAARAGAAQDLLLQYQTLESNEPSRRIASSLGFVPYARSLAVRLVPIPPSSRCT